MLQKQKEKHCLTWLYKNLVTAGLNKLCLRHEISTGIEDIHIVYLDKYLNERFITIFRSSKLSFRIRYNGQTLTARTSKAATALVLELLHDIVSGSDWSKSMTVFEYVNKDIITHGDKVKLYTRGKNID